MLARESIRPVMPGAGALARMHISVILAHPKPGSFNHAIAQQVITSLLENRHRVTYHDLYHEKFDPALPATELASDAELSPEIARYCREVAEADGFVMIHPNWWGQPPALLKGWIDRVLRPRIAYKFIEGDNGEGIPIGLLKARAAIIFNTSNTPAPREESAFGDPLDALWKRCIFDLCGVRSVDRRMFGVVVTSTREQRETWLQEVAAMTKARFGVEEPAAVTMQ